MSSRIDAIDFATIWNSLDSDSKGITSPGILKRLVDPVVQPELYLGMNIPNRKRLLLVRMPANWSEDTSIYPRWKGLDIYVYRSEESSGCAHFLAVSQGTQSTNEVFQSLIADLCNSILLNNNLERVEELIHHRLFRWKVFFEEQKQEGLSFEAQQGLFGELKFIRDYLIPCLGGAAAVRGWTGSLGLNRDFQFGRHAIEVKTTTSKQHQKIIISNERQLDTSGIDHLDILFFPLEIVEGEGEDLLLMISDIIKALEHDEASTAIFNNKLFEAGYLDVHAERYRRKYFCRKGKSYRVSEGFPRILESDLPSGVGDVSYSIMLSACDRFEVPISQVLSDISNSIKGSAE